MFLQIVLNVRYLQRKTTLTFKFKLFQIKFLRKQMALLLKFCKLIVDEVQIQKFFFFCKNQEEKYSRKVKLIAKYDEIQVFKSYMV